MTNPNFPQPHWTPPPRRTTKNNPLPEEDFVPSQPERTHYSINELEEDLVTSQTVRIKPPPMPVTRGYDRPEPAVAFLITLIMILIFIVIGVLMTPEEEQQNSHENEQEWSQYQPGDYSYSLAEQNPSLKLNLEPLTVNPELNEMINNSKDAKMWIGGSRLNIGETTYYFDSKGQKYMTVYGNPQSVPTGEIDIYAGNHIDPGDRLTFDSPDKATLNGETLPPEQSRALYNIIKFITDGIN